MVLAAAPEPEPYRELPQPKERDEEIHEERPRRKAKRKKRDAPSVWAKVGAGVIVALAVIVPAAKYAKIWLALDRIEAREKAEAEREKDRAERIRQGVGKAPVTTEWTRYECVAGFLTIFFPPGSASDPYADDRPGDSLSPRSQSWNRVVGRRHYSVALQTFSAEFAAHADPDFKPLPDGREAEVSTMIAGRKARKYLRPHVGRTGEHSKIAYLEIGLGGGRKLVAVVLGEAGMSLADPTVGEFFERIELVAPNPPADPPDGN